MRKGPQSNRRESAWVIFQAQSFAHTHQTETSATGPDVHGHLALQHGGAHEGGGLSEAPPERVHARARVPAHHRHVRVAAVRGRRRVALRLRPRPRALAAAAAAAAAPTCRGFDDAPAEALEEVLGEDLAAGQSVGGQEVALGGGGRAGAQAAAAESEMRAFV